MMAFHVTMRAREEDRELVTPLYSPDGAWLRNIS